MCVRNARGVCDDWKYGQHRNNGDDRDNGVHGVHGVNGVHGVHGVHGDNWNDWNDGVHWVHWDDGVHRNHAHNRGNYNGSNKRKPTAYASNPPARDIVGPALAIGGLFFLFCMAFTAYVVAKLTYRRRLPTHELPGGHGAASLSASSSYDDTTSAAAHRLPEIVVKLSQQIGAGNFSQVWLATYDGTNVVAKSVSGIDLEAETAALAGLRHPNVVQVLGISVVETTFYLVLQYMELGSLDNYLNDSVRRCDELTYREKHRILADVARGMIYLGRQAPPIVHADLAARNVLLFSDKEGLRAKVTDFGLAVMCNKTTQAAAGAELPYQRFTQETDKRPVPIRWAAPEVFDSDSPRYSPQSDAWSFGVLVWEMFSDGALPYSEIPTNAAVAAFVAEENGRLGIPEALPAHLIDITRTCWNTAFGARPTFSRLLAAIEHSCAQRGAPDDGADSDDATNWSSESLSLNSNSDGAFYQI